jgi:putative Mg2+ transporter-C (MgtC) family protein
MLDQSLDIAARLVSAVLAGAILGINRDLHRKPAGLRTHALVSLGSAMSIVVISAAGFQSDAMSRVIQGLVTGVGFIGAGVILHHEGGEHRVAGLTTAASIWVAAALGIACGGGYWLTAALALILTLVVLTFGGPVEQALERRLRPPADEPPRDAP